ncbi:unnamed protein product [Amoebophrya sp. A25]|nr:unnamed protein product [Amoebophrya sp. A25]|eukprot:GSA25T00019341001.1
MKAKVPRRTLSQQTSSLDLSHLPLHRVEKFEITFSNMLLSVSTLTPSNWQKLSTLPLHGYACVVHGNGDAAQNAVVGDLIAENAM